MTITIRGTSLDHRILKFLDPQILGSLDPRILDPPTPGSWILGEIGRTDWWRNELGTERDELDGGRWDGRAGGAGQSGSRQSGSSFELVTQIKNSWEALGESESLVVG